MTALGVSGHVRAIRRGASELAVGQTVAAFGVPQTADGIPARVRVPATLVVPLDMPDGLVPLDAAAAAIADGPTAYLALVDLGGVATGDAVVVHGATGVFGSMVARLASHLGARPLIGIVDGVAQRGRAAALGYSHVLPASPDIGSQVRAITGGRGADLVIDPLGGALRAVSIAALRPLGRLIAVGQASGEREAPIVARDLWLGSHAVLGLNLDAVAAAEPARFQRAARAVLALVARGALSTDVTDTVALAATAHEHRRLERRAVPCTVPLHVGA